MAKEELVSSEEEKKQASLGGEAESREKREFPRKDEPEDFQTLYEESLKTLEEGQILRGTVIDITPDHVTVDVGYKSGRADSHAGIFEKGQEARCEDRRPDRRASGEEGERGRLLTLSKEKADKITIWRDISRSCREGEVLEGEIVGKVKGGLSVDIGRILAFLPGSQIDLKPIRNLDALIGQRMKFKVIKFNRKRNNIVLSRRVLLDEERKRLREETLKNLKEGDVIEGTVRISPTTVPLSIWVEWTGFSTSRMSSWGRIGHPSEKLSVGDRIKVKSFTLTRRKKRFPWG